MFFAAVTTAAVDSQTDNKIKVGSNLPVIVPSSWSRKHRSLVLRHVAWHCRRCHARLEETAHPLGNCTTMQIGWFRYGCATLCPVWEWPWGVFQVIRHWPVLKNYSSVLVRSGIEISRTGSASLYLIFSFTLNEWWLYLKYMYKMHRNKKQHIKTLQSVMNNKNDNEGNMNSIIFFAVHQHIWQYH